MEPNNSTLEQVDIDQLMKSQMEKAVPIYDSYMKKITLGREHSLRERTVRLAQVKPGDAVLEVGCGTGTLTLEAKRQAGPSGQVFGIDVIPGMIEQSQRKAEQAQMEVSFQLGSIADIPFPANHFDAVMCSFMIFHMSEMTRRQGIAEIYRVLKPQGRFLLVDFGLPPQPLQRVIVRRFFSAAAEHSLEELRPLLETAGFADLEIAPVKFQVLGLSILTFLRGNARKS
jgi:ubiquinone/menaquinone biosynthesis C-methylase UbiE